MGKMKIRKTKVSKKRVPISRFKVLIITVFIFIMMTIMGLYILSKNITPTLMELSQAEAEQAVIYAINYGLSDTTLEEMRHHDANFSKENIENIFKNNEKFVKKTYTNDGRIQSITYDGIAIQQFIASRTARIQKFLRLVEDGKITISHDEDSIIEINDKSVGISTEIPLGRVTNIELLNNVGPTMPIHFEPINNVETTLSRDVIQSKINSTHIQFVVHVNVEVKIVLPFITNSTWIPMDIPLDTQIINNSPTHYYNNGN